VSAGGAYSLALDSSGNAWAWGSNLFGQLGNGTANNSTVPVGVSMPSGVTFISAAACNGNSSLALDSTGHAWAWGDNTHGQLGNGSTISSSVPARVSAPSGVTFSSASAGGTHSLAIHPSVPPPVSGITVAALPVSGIALKQVSTLVARFTD